MLAAGRPLRRPSGEMGETVSLTPSQKGVVVRSGEETPFPAKTNTTYSELLEHLERSEDGRGREPAPSDTVGDRSSLHGFTVAAKAARDMADRASTYDGFEVLARLKTPQTQWQIVFAPEGGGVRYKTSNFREVRLIDLSTVDFSCRVSPLAFTIMHDPGRPF